MRVLTLREALKRGAEKEARFFRVMAERKSEYPPWLYGFRKATVQDDLNGIDAFADTDAGAIPIQIKSSQAGFRYHVTHYGYQHVIVVVTDSIIDVLLRHRVIQLLARRRDILLRAHQSPASGPQ